MKVEIRRVSYQQQTVIEDIEMDIPEDVIAKGRDAVDEYIWDNHWEYSDDNAEYETVDITTEGLDYENPGKDEDDS